MHVRKRSWAAALAVLAGVAVSTAAAPASAQTLPPGNVVVVIVQSPLTSGAVLSFSASCQDGQRVTGGGAYTDGGVHAVITEMQPIHPDKNHNNGRDSFEVTAAADEFGIAKPWSIHVFAFCATVPATLNVQIQPQPNRPTSDSTSQALALCPSGEYVLGTGGKIDNGGGQVDLGMFPNGSGQIVSGSSGFAKEDLDGYSGQYTLTGYAVCGKPTVIFGDFAMVRQQFPAAAGTTSVTGSIPCPNGMTMTGLSGGTTAPGTHLQTIAPSAVNGQPATSATFVAQSSVPQTTPWYIDGEVYCAK